MLCLLYNQLFRCGETPLWHWGLDKVSICSLVSSPFKLKNNCYMTSWPPLCLLTLTDPSTKTLLLHTGGCGERTDSDLGSWVVWFLVGKNGIRKPRHTLMTSGKHWWHQSVKEALGGQSVKRFPHKHTDAGEKLFLMWWINQNLLRSSKALGGLVVF